MSLPLSLIDFCSLYPGERPRHAFQRSVATAQLAEKLGFHRIWYAEHHNMKSIASAAPAVIIAHVGAHTSTIRLGAGGVMLPNHAPYLVAEQFGTLAELYPERIDLGVGRAPGTDPTTLGHALRRNPHGADNFPTDVAELLGFLSAESPFPGIQAIPGADTHIPLYILSSSLFGATLAAKFGLPYSFASHFSPKELVEAVRHYRENFQPSQYLDSPYVIAALNITAAPTTELALQHHRETKRRWVSQMAGRGKGSLSEEELDSLMDSPTAARILARRRYTAVGDGPTIQEYLNDFAKLAQADELLLAVQSPTQTDTAQALKVIAQAWGLAKR
ncbi:LLM class flavin-dependent oxidoreductase [Corynebacterium caspium]|uniref:LLM class flavin-dependent oxidoreductase n=1 Tax=Corynebacterium caspium TaxID=234828 RepID=UPI000370C83C|nr:LLM class flavin-dependent oxidoreductase [Corynebacterium caspium]WKD58878.1 Alkanal monooxygenase alpha chain [Corynebacterium caspium DSM 44850]